jgi:hypothetical protein
MAKSDTSFVLAGLGEVASQTSHSQAIRLFIGVCSDTKLILGSCSFPSFAIRVH